MQLILPKRHPDAHGSGEFGAPRGDRTHNGVDYECIVGSTILSPVTGFVTKIGYPYGDDLSFRYVEIRAYNGLLHRVFYVEPWVKLGDPAAKNETALGTSQQLGVRYEGISEHVHYEVRNAAKIYFNPEDINNVTQSG